jgi:hypothetical protein
VSESYAVKFSRWFCNLSTSKQALNRVMRAMFVANTFAHSILVPNKQFFFVLMIKKNFWKDQTIFLPSWGQAIFFNAYSIFDQQI